MAIQKQLMPVAFEDGLDTNVDPRFVSPNKALLVENLFRSKDKAWEKRLGTTALSTSVYAGGRAITSGRRLAARGSELCMLSDHTLYAWSADQGKWFDRGAPGASVSLELAPVQSSLVNVHSKALAATGAEVDLHTPDVAYGSGLLCFCWEDAGVSFFSIIEEATGQALKPAAQIGTAVRPKVVYSSEGFFEVFVVVEGGANSTLFVQRITVSSLTIAAPVSVSTDLLGTATGNAWYDVQARGDNGNIAVAYRSAASTLKALEWDPTTDTVSIVAVTVVASDVASAALGWMTYNQANGSLYLATAVNGATGVVTRTINGTTLAQSASQTQEASPGDVGNVTGYFDGTNQVAYWEVRQANYHETMVRAGKNGAGGQAMRLGVGLAGRAFQQGTSWYVMCSVDSLVNSTYLLLEGNTTSTGTLGIVARFLRLNGGGLTGGDQLNLSSATQSAKRRNALSSTVLISGSKWITALRRRAGIVATGAATTPQIKHSIVGAVADFGATPAPPVAYSDSLMTPGALPRTYDGKEIYETGFHVDPEPPGAGAAAGAGLGTGVYKYRTLFVVYDAEGRRWESAPSTVTSITTTAGNNQVALTLYHYSPTGHDKLHYATVDAVVEVYRTVVDGVDFYRHSTITVNSTTLRTSSFTDSLPDADLLVGLPLYTTGDALENHPPPPCLHAIMVDDRMVVIPAESPREVWGSMPMVNGEGIGFHPELSIRLDADGDNVALVNLDGRTIVFKSSAIYALVGAWPNREAQGGLPSPQRISNALGTSEPETVVVTPEGIRFRDARKGMCILTRGGEVKIIGETAAYDALDVSAAVLMPDDQTQVRFLTTTGRTLVWDYTFGCWYTFTGWSAVHAAVVGGVFYYLKSNGAVVKEDSATYQDEGVSYACTLSPGWLQQGLQGEQWTYETQVTGDYYSSTTALIVRHYYDHVENAVGDTKTYDLDALGAATPGKWDVAKECDTPRNKAVRPEITFTCVGRGVSLAGMALNVGVKGRLKHLAMTAVG